MCMEREKYQILKELALEFKSSKDPAIFKKILVKVDRLLLQTIHRARRAKPYLKKVDLQDLYQIAVIGLYNALSKVKEDEEGSKLVYKIIRYIGNEIAKFNKTTNRIVFPRSIEDVSFQVHLCSTDRAQDLVHQIENKLTDNTRVYKNLEMEDIRDRFLILLKDEVLSYEEFGMFVMRFVDGMKYKDIAKQFSISYVTVSKKIEDTLNRIRWEWRRRGWEEI